MVAKFAPKIIPQAISELAHAPDVLHTWIGRMPAFQLTPAMPVPLFPSAAAIPATCVPCATAVVGPPSQLFPVNTLPLHSRCVPSRALSTTATTALGLPSVIPPPPRPSLPPGPHRLPPNAA